MNADFLQYCSTAPFLVRFRAGLVEHLDLYGRLFLDNLSGGLVVMKDVLICLLIAI